MNDRAKNIETYEDLLAEKERLEMLVQNQKNLVRHDVDELKEEFRKQIRPVADMATFLKKVIVPERRKQLMLHAGAALAIDLAVTALVSRSHLLVRLVVPGLVKNYAGRILSKFNSVKQKSLSASRKV